MKTHSLSRLVEAHPFFEGLSPTHRALIAGCGKNVRFSSGAFVFHEGRPANEFFVLRDGHVALQIHLPQKGAVTIQTIDPGDIFGFSGLLSPYIWQFDAQAITPIHALSFDARCLRAKFDEDPRLGYELVHRFSRVLLDRLQSTRVRLLDMYGDATA